MIYFRMFFVLYLLTWIFPCFGNIKCFVLSKCVLIYIYNFISQVADFGLAKFTSDANTHVSTRVMGTFGYEILSGFTVFEYIWICN